MKKQIVFSLILLSSIITVNAQWSVTNPVYTTSKVGIGTSTPLAGLHVVTSDNSSGNNITAIFGNNYNDWTYFGGIHGGRIRGSNEGYLTLESNADGTSDNQLYLNVMNPGNVSIARGGGNVAIGSVFYPREKLEVNGNIELEPTTNVSNGFMGKFSFTPGGTGYYAQSVSYIGSVYEGTDWWNGTALVFATNAGPDITNGGVTTEKMRINRNGNVGIGTTSPDAKLSVKGTIHCQEVKVDLTGAMADFVFAPTYKLRPLSEVEKYVKANSHLPEIPSAAEVAQNGLSLGEMQNKLLQKVEELTLYSIEQDKTNAELKQKLAEQEKELKELKELINQRLK